MSFCLSASCLIQCSLSCLEKQKQVPGVVGIGPKTAAALVNQFNSVEELLENVSKIVDSKKRKLYPAILLCFAFLAV